jgi:hypothetical protein
VIQPFQAWAARQTWGSHLRAAHSTTRRFALGREAVGATARTQCAAATPAVGCVFLLRSVLLQKQLQSTQHAAALSSRPPICQGTHMCGAGSLRALGPCPVPARRCSQQAAHSWPTGHHCQPAHQHSAHQHTVVLYQQMMCTI